MITLRSLIMLAYIVVLSVAAEVNDSKKKKDVRDFTDADIERLFDEWEENDEDIIPDDEKPDYEKPKPQVSLEDLKKQASDPDDLLRLSKKGQSIMMFVSVTDGSTVKAHRSFTEKMAELWASNLHNNHIEVTSHVIEDDRLLFLFRDGSRAWEGKEFLLKQPQCKEITLEGVTTPGAGAQRKTEL